MAEIRLVKRVKYAGDIHKKLVELGWDLETAALFCDDLPDADVAEVRPELRKAVKLLEKNYERGVNSDFVHDPLAWALYQTWKTMNGGSDNDNN